MTKYLYCLLLLGLLFTDGKAQGVHFTSYDFAPLNINPALTGAFSGTYRLGGIYRDQWRSASAQGAYSTINAHVDLPIIRGIRKQDWVGLGLSLYNDNSSIYGLRQTESVQGISYHLALDKKQNRYISFGIQNGTGVRSVRLRGDLRTESLILTERNLSSVGSADNQLLANMNNSTIIDWVGGVMFSSYLQNLSFVRAGFSVGQINRPDQSIASTGSTDRQGLKYTAFALYDFPIAGNVFMTPSAFYQRTKNNQELVIQNKASFLINEAKKVYVSAGAGWRVGDALQFMMGADIRDIRVQLAYDANISRFRSATNTVGAFELAVSYIGKIYKKPKVDPTEVCPRL